MTVTTDLALQSGVRRRLFVRIDGLSPALWEAADNLPIHDIPAGDLECLHAPQSELGWGLDIGEMKVSPPSLTIELDNIRDPDNETLYYFARLFAPGRHARTDQRVANLDLQSGSRYLSATATSIVTTQNLTAAGWAATGTAYIGQETFTYTGIGGSGNTTFTGCTRGAYPCIGSLASQTHKVSISSSAENSVRVATVPYSWIGKRIALYCVTWDTTTGAWVTAANGKLLWIGRISSMRWNGESGTWELGCEHLMADLEQELGVGMPTGTLASINMLGTVGMTLNVMEIRGIASRRVFNMKPCSVDVFGKSALLAAQIQASLNNANNWATTGGGTAAGYATYSLHLQDGKYILSATAYNANLRIIVNIGMNVRYQADGTPLAGGQASWACHPMHALGFSRSSTWTYVNQDEFADLKTADEAPAVAYHPISLLANGSRLVCAASTSFWTDQGDYGTASAAVGAEGATATDGGGEYTYSARYNSTSTVASWITDYAWETVNCFVLHSDQNLHYGTWVANDYLVAREGGEAVTIKQIYAPHVTNSAGTNRGPFELLLYPLLSSGTTDYLSATYDKVPYEFMARIDSALVDVQSFLDADAEVIASDLAKRDRYIISEPTPWLDLLRRESQLFGYVLAWDASQGKFALRNVFAHDIAGQVVTLNEGNNCCTDGRQEFPDADTSIDTIINQWKCKVGYDPAYDTWSTNVVIDDEESQASVRTIKSVDIEHPGITKSLSTGVDTTNALLAQLLLKQGDLFRYPWQVVTRSLAPNLIGRVSIGDVVSFVSSSIPDPYGSGAMGVTCMAVVLNVTWNLRDWTGNATLLLYSQYSASLKAPWAGSALVDIAATNGGWDSANKRLTLIAQQWGTGSDSDDGACFFDGDFVDVVERAPASPTAPQRWTALEVAKDYEGDGAQLLTLTSATLTGWNAAAEYVVLPTFVTSAAAQQLTLHTWHANATTHILGASGQAQKYG